MLKRRIKRQLGYLAYQQGISNHCLRGQGGWDSHLKRTREYILEGVKDAAPETVTIFGSGWLLDVPVQELVILFMKGDW